jgi:uncharacterized protein YggE
MRALSTSMAALTLAAGLVAAPALAHDAHPMDRTIVVTGIGEASATPDIAYLNLGVEAEGATAAEALRKNSAQMDATIKLLRDAGVDKKDIQTSSLNVGAKYDYSRDNSPPRIIGYQATNTVSVKLRNLDKAGAIIDKAVGVGANRLDSISFGFADPKPLMNSARKSAVADARDRAGLYADAAGVKLGPVLQISDSFTPGPGPIPMMMRMEATDAKSVPIAVGETAMSASVTIIYAIE